MATPRLEVLVKFFPIRLFVDFYQFWPTASPIDVLAPVVFEDVVTLDGHLSAP
jgi:hypothetical protein